MVTRRLAAVLLGLCWLLVGCDHGSVLLAENQTDDELLARARGTTDQANSQYSVPTEIVAILAPNSKLVVAEMPFTGGFRIQHLDILRADCSLLDGFPLFGENGTYIVIDDGFKVRLRDENPQSGTAAATTERCRTMPSSSASPSPGSSSP